MEKKEKYFLLQLLDTIFKVVLGKKIFEKILSVKEKITSFLPSETTK